MAFTAIITAYNRKEQTLETISRLQALSPAPDEIIVHFDNGSFFELPEGVKSICSKDNLGPGGGRHKLISHAAHEYIASFDDDSYPLDQDFFLKAENILTKSPNAAVIACDVFHKDEKFDQKEKPLPNQKIASFIGCGCIYKKSVYEKLSGYVALPVAYGMEEVDLSLQVHNLERDIIFSPDLRVFHDTELSHHECPNITAGSIMNQALLVTLRYPFSLWPLGICQWTNKLIDNIKRKRISGSVRALLGTPIYCLRHISKRDVVKAQAISTYRSLR